MNDLKQASKKHTFCVGRWRPLGWFMLLFVHVVSALASPLIHRVVVSSGTHGNEYTGVYVVHRLQLQQEELAAAYPSLAVETLVANPLAHEGNRRFVHADLNRMFTEDGLADLSAVGYEPNRAKAIHSHLGPKGPDANADMIIDLHSTTANMGCTLIVDEWCPLALHVAAFVQSCWSTTDGIDEADSLGDGRSMPLYILLHANPDQSRAPYLSSVGKNGMQIEVGPTPQGMLRADCIAATERALRLILRYLELHNTGRAPPPASPTLQVYVDKGKVPWGAGPPGSSLPGSIVHPSLQDRDYTLLRAGDPLFVRLDGTVDAYDGSLGQAVHPIFINEAAYYYSESGRGISICEQVDWPMPALP
jgi:succinylglutamate desuccinylase